MKDKLSSRSKSVTGSIFNALAQKRQVYEASGINIYDLSIEMPDMAPSLDIREAVSGSATKAWNYSYSLGDMPQLKEAACSWYQARYNVLLDPEYEITSADGIPDALFCLLNVLTDPGDKVLLQNPCDPYYLSVLTLAGLSGIFMPLKAENDYLPDFSAISEEDAASCKVMIISYPNNPTTATAGDDFYLKLIEFASGHDITVIHDNSYSDIVFDNDSGKSFLAYPKAKEIGVEINSLASSYSAYGMDPAFILGNRDIISSYCTLKSGISTGSFFPVQYGMIAALTSDQSQVEETISLFEYRRDTMIEALKGTGLTPVPCHATPFLWIKLPESFSDDIAFTDALLKQAHVLVTPGSAFGSEGKGYIRMALNRRRPFLIEAANAIRSCQILN